MAPPPTQWQRTALRAAETLLIGTIGGVVFTLIGFPAGLVSGSLLSVAVGALAGRPLIVPRPLSRDISVLGGILLGAVVAPETRKRGAGLPLSHPRCFVAHNCMFA